MKKRLISLLLAVCMALTFLPGSTLAAEIVAGEASLTDLSDLPDLPNSPDAYFQMQGANGLNAYTMSYGDDSYYYSGFQTVFLLNEDGSAVTEGSTIKPVFKKGAEVVMFAAHDQDGNSSAVQQDSGVTEHTFNNGRNVSYSAARENGSHLKNYWVTFLTRQNGPALFVNGINSIIHTDMETGYPVREIILGGKYGNHYDIFLANIGDQPLTGLSVELDEDTQTLLTLDERWDSGKTSTLSPCTTIEDDSTGNGELANTAKIRLIPQVGDDGKYINGTIDGVLTIKADGMEPIHIKLNGQSGVPEIVTDNIRNGIRFVHYSSLIQTNYTYGSDGIIFTAIGLPNGLIMKPNGEICGIPTQAGTFTIEVTASNDAWIYKEHTRGYTFTIEENTNQNVEAANLDDQGYPIEQRLTDMDGSIQDQEFVSEGEFAEFMDVYLDGHQLNEGTDYTVEEGSTKIMVHAQTFRNAGNGMHTISAEFRSNANPDGDMKRTAQNFTISGLGSGGSGGGGGTSGFLYGPPNGVKYVPYSYFYRPYDMTINLESAEDSYNWTDYCNVCLVFPAAFEGITPYIDGIQVSRWDHADQGSSTAERYIGIPAGVFEETGAGSHTLMVEFLLPNGDTSNYTLNYSVTVNDSLTKRYYSEISLPSGLTMDSKTGEVYGVPVVDGVWKLTLGMEYLDADGVVQDASVDAAMILIEDNTNIAVQRPNDYVITDPVGTPDPNDPNHFYMNEYRDETMVIDGEFSEFRDLYIDGTRLMRNVDYTAREGSTVITIRSQTFRRFGEGTHTIAAEYRTGSGSSSTLKRVAQNYTLTLPQNSGNSGGSSGGGSSNRRPSSGTTKPAQTVKPETVTPQPALPFTDISPSDWFYDDVVWAYQNGIMLGVTETRFAPQIEISQATIVTVLARLAKADLSRFEGVQEEGIAPGQQFTTAAIWAKRAGLLADRNNFTGTETTTREQMAVMLVNYLRSVGIDTTPPVQPVVFADASEMSESGNAAFQVLYQKEIFKGVGGMRMNAVGTTTRTHFVALIHRIAQTAQ